tara:strand:+ start:5306 stop:5929 length:624 start_codon:yes stop_codon:yes gene_type:complete
MDRMPDITMPEVETTAIDDSFEVPPDLISDDEAPITEDIIDEVIPEPVIDKHLDNREIFKAKKGASLAVNKIKKPKRVMTEEHKERLKKGRETALANRRAKAKAKKEPEPNKEPPLDPPPAPREAEPKIIEKYVEIPNPGLTEDQVLDLVAKASQKSLENYEYLRKKRKEAKKEANKEEADRKEIRNTIQRATSIGINPNNPWGNCY